MCRSAGGIHNLKEALAQLRPFFRGITAIGSYSKEREVEAAGDNKRVCERLMGETYNAPPGLSPARGTWSEISVRPRPLVSNLENRPIVYSD